LPKTSAGAVNSTARGSKDPNHIINRKNQKGQTLLYFASKYGNLKIVQSLIEMGADPMIASAGELPVQVAERWNHIEVFEYYLKSKLYDPKVISACFKNTTKQPMARLVKKYYGAEGDSGASKRKYNCCLIF
jgi:ankyrin repeat protein